MKKTNLRYKNFFSIILFIFWGLILNGQEVLQSIETNEAMSIKPDQIDDVPADLKIRITTGDTATYEGFVKFDISTVDVENLSNASVMTWGGQHNPSGVAFINPYWIDMYGCNTVNWPNPFTWNSTRSMHKSELLASESILGFNGGYTFGGESVAEWIKTKKSEGATEVVFRFYARTEHPWDIWISGTWKGMELKLEFAETHEDLSSYKDTIAKINFTYNDSFDESGWTNVYGTSSFPINPANGITVSCSGGILNTGSSGEPTTLLPSKVGGTYNFIEQANNDPVELTVTGLDPTALYKFDFFTSREGSEISEESPTNFYIKNPTEGKNGEFLIMDDTYTYNDELKGFKWLNVYEVEDAPNNWKSPYDYEMGEIYERYEVLSQATNQTSNLQFGIWQDGGQREAVSSHTTLNGPGSIGTRHSSPSTWWQLDEDNHVDFTRPSDILHFGIPLWSDQYKLVTVPEWSSNSDWERRNLYHPMTVRATIVAVPEGGTFSGWKFWKKVHNNISINSVGNKDSMLVIAGITPSALGEIKISITKDAGKYGYINAMIITKNTLTATSFLKSENIKYYPVPTSDYLNITNLPVNSSINVYNCVGKKVFTQENGQEKQLRISIENLKKGIYVFQATSSGEVIKTFKVIKY